MGQDRQINIRNIAKGNQKMTTYLSHMNNFDESKAFERRVEYLIYNFKNYLNKLTADSRILEIGPGKGELIYLLNKIGVINIDIIDNDSAIITYCKKTFNIKKAILAKSLDMGKSLSGHYDLIILTQVFEHIPKSSYMNWIKALYSALNPGGHIIITVPNGANPLVGTERYGDLQHENIFTIYSFKELVTFAGLKNSTYTIQGFEISPKNIVNIVRIILQKILHCIFILLMIINGGIYQTLMTPNITLIIKKNK